MESVRIVFTHSSSSARWSVPTVIGLLCIDYVLSNLSKPCPRAGFHPGTDCRHARDAVPLALVIGVVVVLAGLAATAAAYDGWAARSRAGVRGGTVARGRGTGRAGARATCRAATRRPTATSTSRTGSCSRTGSRGRTGGRPSRVRGGLHAARPAPDGNVRRARAGLQRQTLGVTFTADVRRDGAAVSRPTLPRHGAPPSMTAADRT